MQKSRSPAKSPKSKSPVSIKKAQAPSVSSQQTASSSQPTKKSSKSPAKSQAKSPKQEKFAEEEKKSSRSKSPQGAKSKNSDRSKSPTAKFSQLSISNKKVKNVEVDDQILGAPTFKIKGSPKSKAVEKRTASPALQLTGSSEPKKPLSGFMIYSNEVQA